MGMYTELVLGVDLDEDTPSNIIDILKWMLTGVELCAKPFVDIPKHPLFNTERWNIMLCCDSAYFPGVSDNSWETGVLDEFKFSIRSNLKNYDNEIELFLHFIEPYIDRYFYGFIGYMLREDVNHPTLIYRTDNGIKFIKTNGVAESDTWYLDEEEWLRELFEKGGYCLKVKED